jgi:hypothetical protein
MMFDRDRKTEESVVGGEALVRVDINVLRLFGLDLDAFEGKVSEEETFEGEVFEEEEEEEEAEGMTDQEGTGGEEPVLSVC